MSKDSDSTAGIHIVLRVGSTLHASRIAKALKDMRYTSSIVGKVDVGFGLQFMELLASMPEMREGNG